MKSLCLYFFLTLRICGALSLDVIPNIGYLLRGYHLYEGNPLATQVTSDPGFQNHLFEPKYTKNLQSADLKYLIPDGTKVYPKEGCTQAFNNELIQSGQQYQSLLKDMVKTNYTGFDHSFKGSSDFQQVHSSHSTDSSTQTLMTQIICLKYEAVLDTTALPLYSSVFVDEIRKAYAIYQRNSSDTESTNMALHKILNSYGTHFVRKIELGSRYTYQTHLNSNHRYALDQAGIDMRAGAVLSMTRKMGHQLTEEELHISQEFDKLVSNGRSSSSSFSYNPDGTLDTMSSTPIPLYYEIERLDELFSRSYMKTAGLNYKQLNVLFSNYFDNYCEYEKKYSGEDRCKTADTSDSSASSISRHNFKVVFSENGEGSSTNSILWRKKLPELTALTISWWMRAARYTSESTSRRHILSYSLDSIDYIKILASPEEEGGCVQLELDGEVVPITSPCLIPFDNHYHHYVVVWSSEYGRWQIYIDGNIMAGGSARCGFVLPEGGYLVIGQQHDTGTVINDPLTAFQGEIAFLNIWDFIVNGVEARRLGEDNGIAEGNVVSWDQDKLKFYGDGLDVSAVISNDEFFKA